MHELERWRDVVGNTHSGAPLFADCRGCAPSERATLWTPTTDKILVS